VLERDYRRVAILGLRTLVRVFPPPDHRESNYNYKPEYVVIPADIDRHRIESGHLAVG
jgi:hypothetical protein